MVASWGDEGGPFYETYNYRPDIAEFRRRHL